MVHSVYTNAETGLFFVEEQQSSLFFIKSHWPLFSSTLQWAWKKCQRLVDDSERISRTTPHRAALWNGLGPAVHEYRDSPAKIYHVHAGCCHFGWMLDLFVPKRKHCITQRFYVLSLDGSQLEWASLSLSTEVCSCFRQHLTQDAQAMDLGLTFAELHGHGPVAAHHCGLQRHYSGLHWSLAPLHGIAAQHGASTGGARCGQYLAYQMFKSDVSLKSPWNVCRGTHPARGVDFPKNFEIRSSVENNLQILDQLFWTSLVWL